MKRLSIQLLILGLVALLLIGTVSAATVTVQISNDGQVKRVNSSATATFAEMRNGAGTGLVTTNLSNNFFYTGTTGVGELSRYGMTFDLSPYSGGTISSIKLCMYGRPSKTNEFAATIDGVVINASPASTSEWVATDYNKFGNTVLGNYSYSGWTDSVWNNATLDTAYFQSKLGTKTSVMFVSSADFDNTFTFEASKNYAMKSYQDYEPGKGAFLEMEYTGAVGGGGSAAGILTNRTATNAPLRAILFTDNSTFTATSWVWTYKDYHNTTVVEHSLSTLSSFTHSFGAGNFSFQLNASNATYANKTPDLSYWINVSAGVSGNSSWDGDYQFYPSDNIFNTDISTLPIHSKSAAWKTNLTAQSGSHPHATYSKGLNTVRNFVVNSTFSKQPLLISSRQTWTDNRFQVPIPDDFGVNAQGTDYPGGIFDFENQIQYSLGSVSKNPNGTWNGRLFISNWSNNYNRFYPNTFLGNYYIKDTDQTNRTNTTSFWGPSMIGIAPFATSLRYDEVASGEINHAFYLIIPYAGNASSTLWPAINTGDSGDRTYCPAPGSYWRLNASYDVDAHGLGTGAKVVATALKKYGAYVGDNGASYGFQIYTVNDTRWDTADLTTLDNILISDFEAVDVSSLMVDRYSMRTNGVPVADFSADVTSGVYPLTVQFTDLSSRSPTSWSWDFGDGVPITTQNPSHIFSSPGIYSVALTATNAFGSDMEIKAGYITVSSLPTANFTADVTTGNAPLTVQFTDDSSSATSWVWDFDNDGDTDSTTQSPSYTYTLPGSYTVNLTAYNVHGGDSEIKADYIVVGTTPPVADFIGYNTYGNAPLAVLFSDQSTNTPTSWLWNFGDGNTSTSQSPSHTYSYYGNFTVTLTATNAGGSDIESKSGYVSVVAYPYVTPTATPTPTPTPAPTSGPGSHPRSMATATLPTIPGERYDALTRVLGFGNVESTDTPNWSGAPPEIVGVYTDYMGPIAFLLIFLIPFGMIWMSHGNMKLLAVLGCITGLFVFQYLPANYTAAAVICIVVSVAAGIWGVFKQ